MSAIRDLLSRVRNWFKPQPSVLLAPGTSLLAMDGFVPPGFEHGIEILNDDETPMVFVVWVLEQQLGLDNASAVRMMLQIHAKGGALLSLQTRDEAAQVASAITSHAKERGHPLSCKAVSVSPCAGPNS
jgi:ATP-dependent Clp protease adaptor protein ClpS